MEIELKEIRDFIAAIPPFDRLDPGSIDRLVDKITIRYFRSGSALPPDNADEEQLYIIRKGALSLRSRKGTLLGKLGESDVCTSFCLADGGDKFRVSVDEDTLAYTVDCDSLNTAVGNDSSVLAFIRNTASQRLNQAMASRQEAASTSPRLTTMLVGEVMQKPAVTVDAGSSIHEAAIRMRDASVSSLIVVDDDAPRGIVTDKDITRRCVATGKSPANPVDTIMTAEMVTTSSDANAFDALMTMTRKHIHHLPVIDDNRVEGVVSISDLMRLEGRNVAYLSSAIHRATDIDTLKELSATIPRLQVQLVNQSATPDHVGKVVTSITSALTRRLLQLAEEKFGPPPVPYAWVAAGSHARREQTSHSDQDNGMIISDALEKADEPWFEQVADFVCDGLNECGYVYCPGDVMAKNPRWRQTQSVWQGYFNSWINTPEPKALMYSSIFFDLRTIHGEATLLEQIRENMLAQTPESTLFLAHLTHNALKLRPPLGFFRDFVLIHDGKHNDTLDLKHNGIAPVVDLARIYALSEGIPAVNTIERLKAAAGTPTLSESGSANLLDALEFIGILRLEHQARQIQRGEAPDNFMSPKEISRLEREHLKDAFKVIQTMQATLESRYRM